MGNSSKREGWRQWALPSSYYLRQDTDVIKDSKLRTQGVITLCHVLIKTGVVKNR